MFFVVSCCQWFSPISRPRGWWKNFLQIVKDQFSKKKHQLAIALSAAKNYEYATGFITAMIKITPAIFLRYVKKTQMFWQLENTSCLYSRSTALFLLFSIQTLVWASNTEDIGRKGNKIGCCGFFQSYDSDKSGYPPTLSEKSHYFFIYYFIISCYSKHFYFTGTLLKFYFYFFFNYFYHMASIVNN